MIWVAVAAVIVLGGFCVALYMGQEKRQTRHDEQVAKLVQQITRTNPADATLKAMKMTSEVLTDAVDKVTGTIGTSFAAATGLSGGGPTIIDPPDAPEDDDGPVEMAFPDIEMDGMFIQPDYPTTNGYIGGRVSNE